MGVTASRSGNLARLIELIYVRPVISIGNVQEWLGITQPGACNLVQQMIDGDILIEITGRKRNRRFAAPEILAIINPEDQEP